MAETYSSVSRVFAIPELTESILLHTYALCTTATGASEHEPRSISWKNDINDLKAESNGMRWLLCTANRVNRFWNSIISTSAPIQERLFLQWHSRQNRTLKYNPLMASKFTWGYIGRYKVFPCGEEKFLQALLYRDASWRRMFPVVPPVRRVEVHQEIRPGRFADNERKNGRIALDDLPEKDGLRMGMLFDIAEEWKKPLNASLFHVKWVGDVDIEKIRMEE
ncbi:hypothetical protein BU26DRAFT_40374 [Trematosphaeria pertusa]|uniref:Uncharacterized protein n=1 Tax=Trematosphaeria pertusa TaxID=390896 RepID=A0A6A6J4X5_9PLEO|nr:uncharacterized protein BU26DRAFT_40374 [Trematosphaeria pertusa]KAF2257282.1 hypothetical protein BU26DRAFT_40374 [Trematosphaeria pertusa]